MNGPHQSCERTRARVADLGRLLDVAPLMLALLALPGCGDSSEDSGIVSLIDGLLSGHEMEAPLGRGETSEEPGVVDRAEVQEPDVPRPGRIIEFEDVSTLEDPGMVSEAKALFSYVDESGGTRMVQGLHNVPYGSRATAKNLSNDGKKIYRYDGAALAARRRPRPVVSGSDFNPNRLDVTLFSAPWCGACRRAKKLLDRERIAYDLRDIDDDPSAREEVRRILGNVQIPLLDIDGTYVVGYNRKAITRLIKGG